MRVRISPFLLVFFVFFGGIVIYLLTPDDRHRQSRVTEVALTASESRPTNTESTAKPGGEQEIPAAHRPSPSPAKAAGAIAVARKIGPAPDEQGDIGIREIRTLDTLWLDPVGKQKGLRVRVIESDFKYPLLRVLERVVVDTEGKHTVEFVHAEVADHLIVAREPGMEKALTDAGWKLRESNSGRFLLAEVPEPEKAGSLPEAMENLRKMVPAHLLVETDPLHWICATSPNDPNYNSGKLWGLHNPGGRSGYLRDADIDAPEAWDNVKDAPGVVVAVIDTGIRFTHEDLADNMWRNPGEIAGNGIDDDGNGVTDDIHGFNAAANNGSPADDQGHGTHCAGTIGAVGNNGKGITGVAWKVQLMAVKFLTATGGGTTSDAIRSVDYARANGAHIISASWGGGPSNATLLKAIVDAGNSGIPFVAAAGNSGTNNDASPHYPSSYLASNVLAVAASNSMDKLADFSCYGRDSVDVAAPGVDILSTYHSSNSAYKSLSGTSMATPHVSGMLALAKTAFPQDDEIQLIARLLKTADRKAAYNQKVKTGARANLDALLADATNPGDPDTGGPENDMFAKPTIFTGTSVAWDGANRRATREADEDSYNPAPGNRTIWFTWTPPASGSADAVVSAVPEGMNLRMVVFGGTEKSSLRVIADSGLSAQRRGPARARFAASAGTTYRICIASANSAGQGLALRLGLRPSNDNVADATELSGDRFEDTSSNVGATAESHELLRPHLGNGVGKSIWWKWTAPFDGPMVLTTDGSEFDTLLAVYQRREDGLPGEVVAENDDQGPLDGSSGLEFEAVSGRTYLIAIDSYRADEQGLARLNGFRPGPPVILSQPQDLEVSLGTRATFSVGAGGALRLLYQWFKDGAALPGQKSPTLVIDPVKNEDLGQYHVEVSNGRESTASRAARLAEKLLPPVITWTSGDLALQTGDTMSLKVIATGSTPMTYRWYKDSQLLAESGSELRVATVAPTDAGSYQCVVSNALGEASTRMMVSIVTSPFEGFSWTLPSVPNGSIKELKVIDGLCYALTSDRILISSNGLDWNDVRLPRGFMAANLVKFNGQFLCIGARMDGLRSVCFSTDGRTWGNPQPATVTEPGYSPEPRGAPFTQLEVLNGRLLALSTPTGYGSQYGGVYYSTDGLTWSRSLLRAANGTTNTFLVSCRLVIRNGTAYLAGSIPGIYPEQTAVYKTNDGVIWDFLAMPAAPGTTNSGAGLNIHDAGGKFYLLRLNGAFESTDGTTWVSRTTAQNSSANIFRGVETSDGYFLFAVNGSSQGFRFGPDPLTSTEITNLAPDEGQYFTCAVNFQGAVVYGTTNGLLRRITKPDQIKLAPGSALPLIGMDHLNGEFLAFRRGISYNPKVGGAPLQVSGDGKTWRSSNVFYPYAANSSDYTLPSCYFADRYWGDQSHRTSQPLGGGWVPGGIGHAGMPPGLEGEIADAEQAPDGTWLVLSRPPTSGGLSSLYSVSEDGQLWTKLTTTGLQNTTFSSFSRLMRLNNRWIIYSSLAEQWTSAHLHSEDGINWSSVTGSWNSLICPYRGKLYEVSMPSYPGAPAQIRESTDGVAWGSAVSTSLGIGGVTSTSMSIKLKRLFVYQDRLILVLRDEFSARGFILFSEDAINWFPANAPFELVDAVVGGDRLVGVAANGGIILATSGTSGSNAPRVEVASPRHRSVHIENTMVEIAGSSSDPDGDGVTTECRVDGVSLGIVAGNTWRFQFRPTSLTGHTIGIRTTDSTGLVGSAELLISSTTVQRPNLIESAEGTGYLPTVATASFGGRIYVAGPWSVYRSTPEGAWERVNLPNLPTSIIGLVAGNGTLIVQTGRALIVTRDGINWAQMNDLGSASTFIVGSLNFKNGWFIGYTGWEPFYSQDGFNWTMGRTSSSTTISVVNGDGSLLSIDGKRSVDAARNWRLMPEFTGLTSFQMDFRPAYGKLFAGLHNGTILRSDDHGATWTTVHQFPALPAGHQAKLALHAGRLYWGGGGWWKGASTDGTTWHTLTGDRLQSTEVQTANGKFVGFGITEMVWSDDGLSWQKSPSSPRYPQRGLMAADSSGLVMVDRSGGTWKTEDGLVWQQGLPGLGFDPTSTGSTSGTGQIQFKGRAISTGLMFSDTSGLTYAYGNVEGCTLPYGWPVKGLWCDANHAFATVSTASIEGASWQLLLRSPDGMNWTQMEAWPDENIVGMQSHDSTWVALTKNGRTRVSIDNGATWSENTLPDARTGTHLLRFANRWVAIVVEGATTASPYVCYSSENGLSWTRHGPLPLVDSFNALYAVADSAALVIAYGNGKVYTATDANFSWQLTASTSTIYSDPPPLRKIGNLFCLYQYLVSSDGLTWRQPTVLGYNRYTPVAYINGNYICYPYSRQAAWSPDGLNWTMATVPSDFPYGFGTVHQGDTLRFTATGREIWETGDGIVWQKIKDSVPASPATAHARKIIAHGNRLIAGGTTGLMLYSDDDGQTWAACSRDSGAAFPATHTLVELKRNPAGVVAAFLTNASAIPPQYAHYRSVDGIHWQQMPGLTSQNVMSFAANGNDWMALRYGGGLLRSSDGGMTWAEAGAVPGIQIATSLARYNGLWLVAATLTTGSAQPLHLLSSPDGINWTSAGASGLTHLGSVSTPHAYFHGHGAIFFGMGRDAKRSEDGLLWNSLPVSRVLSGASDLYSNTVINTLPMADHYLTFASSTNNSYYWTAPLSGGVWTLQTPYQNQIKAVDSPDGRRLFLFGDGSIKEHVTTDLALGLGASPPTGTYGVGDLLTVPISISNPGSAAVSPVSLKARAWFSSDGFFGDGNDVYLGETEIPPATYDVGIPTPLSLEFRLPASIEPGDQHLIVRLETEGSLEEKNTANNTVISREALIHIPQWQLTLTTLGSGEVISTSTRRFYPHKSSIGLFAKAGKGAAFSGWGGDAIGGLSEIGLLMDGDKSVSATFTPQAPVRIVIRGNGSVNVPESGSAPLGATLALEAFAAPGWQFSGWKGAINGQNPTTNILVDGPKTIEAMFSQTFEGWRGLHFHGEDATAPFAARGADADGDGIPNWREFLHGSDPRASSSTGILHCDRLGNEWVVIFTRNANPSAARLVSIEASHDLRVWRENLMVLQLLSSEDGIETLEARLPVAGSPRGFIRLAYPDQ